MTRQQWFETLPPAYAERAIRNTAQDWLSNPCPNLYYAACGGFFWGNSPEGHDFWSAVVNGSLPPIPVAETPEPVTAYTGPVPPAGFVGITGPLRVLATEYQQGDIMGYGGDRWYNRFSSGISRYSTWTGCDEGGSYALRIGSELAIANGIPNPESVTPEPQPAAPAYRYFHIPDSHGVWRVGPDSCEYSFGTHEGPWGAAATLRERVIDGGSCGRIMEFFPDTPTAPPVLSPPAAGEFRVRLGYRYRTRDGRTSGYIRYVWNPVPDTDFPFMDTVSCLTFKLDGSWIDDKERHEDLVEEITPTTIEEWLHTIPESEAALRNMRTLGCCGGVSPSEEAGNAHDALWVAFNWSRSPEGPEYWRDVRNQLSTPHAGTVSQSAAHPTPAPAPATPSPPPPAPKQKYRITEVRHYFLEAEDEIEADRMFRDATDPARRFRVRIEDREIHNDA